MPQIFDADGNPIDVASLFSGDDPLELPEDVIQNHPAYVEQRNLFEQERDNRINDRRNFRSRIQELEAANQQPPAPEEDEENNDTGDDTPPAPEPPAVEPLDEDALYERFLSRMQREQEEARAAAQNRTNAIGEILVEHGLPETYRPVLNAYPSLDAARAAAEVIGSDRRFDDPEGFGGRTTPTSLDSLFANADSQLGITGDTDN
jgi:hypothetical protein